MAVWTTVILLASTCTVLTVARPWGAAPSVSPLNAPGSATTSSPVLHRIAVVGDSYVGGSDMGGNGMRSWVVRVAEIFRMGGVELEAWTQSGGGSGYVARGESSPVFGDLVSLAVQPDSEVVIFFGSRNDSGRSEIQEEAEASFRRALTISPDAELLVIGVPWVNSNVPPEQLENRDAVRAAAQAVGATFVDPLKEGWFTGTAEGLIGSDGVHPTDDGHYYLAEKILPHLQAALVLG